MRADANQTVTRDLADVQAAWPDMASDYVERRAALLAEDTDEARGQREQVLELLDLVITTLAARAEEGLDVHDLSGPAPLEPQTIVVDDWVSPEEPEPEPEDEAEDITNEVAEDITDEDDVSEEMSVLADTFETGAATPEVKPRRKPTTETDILPQGVSGWQAEVELLYNDVLRLFALGDTDGALVSLERLLIIAPPNDQLRNFLRLNEPKLMKLYEGVMGPWSNVPHKVENADAPEFFNLHAKFKSILHLVDGRRSLGTILDESYFLPLETCAVLNQLVRAKVILAHDVPL